MRPKRTKTGPQHGFTLTELMIVIVIMGILIAASVPAMGKFMRSWRLNGDANEMATALRLARTAAVSKHTDVIFVFDANTGQYYYLEDKNGNGSHDSGEYESAVHDLSGGVRIAAFDTPQQWITFGSKGNTVDGGSITLSNSSNSSKLIRIFSGTGNITVD